MQHSIGNNMPTYALYALRPFHVIQPQSKYQKYSYSWATIQLGLRSHNPIINQPWCLSLVLLLLPVIEPPSTHRLMGYDYMQENYFPTREKDCLRLLPRVSQPTSWVMLSMSSVWCYVSLVFFDARSCYHPVRLHGWAAQWRGAQPGPTWPWRAVNSPSWS